MKGEGGWIQGDLEMPASMGGPLVMGAGWMLEMVRFENRSRTFGLYLASFGIIDFDIPEFSGGGLATFVGFSSPGKPPADWLQSSMLFDLGDRPLAKTPEALVKLFSKPRPYRNVDAAAKASLLSLRIKRRICETYRDTVAIAQIAEDLGVSHAHATRQFKRDFGFTPINYRHQLRATDAFARLFRGDDILDVGHDVGFSDTSRFYHDFRKVTGSSPGQCRDQKTPRLRES
jgi:AraC-like DNA-binding protein